MFDSRQTPCSGPQFAHLESERLDLVTKGVCQLWNPPTCLLCSFSFQNPSACLLFMQGNKATVFGWSQVHDHSWSPEARGSAGFHRTEKQNPVRVCCALCFLESACKPEFPAHTLEQAVLPLKPKKVAGAAIYLSHGFHNFPGTLASH